jgi:hypothetical protein
MRLPLRMIVIFDETYLFKMPNYCSMMSRSSLSVLYSALHLRQNIETTGAESDVVLVH